MELELKKEQFACYQALPQLSENREETTETIVPDYLPDIARIVDAFPAQPRDHRRKSTGVRHDPHDAFVCGGGHAGNEIV